MDNSSIQTEQSLQQEPQQTAKGLVSKILTLLLTLLFFLPWFTFKACNMTYEYSGYSTVVFQPSNDIGQLTDKIADLGKNLSDKKDDKSNNKSGGNDFTIISSIAAVIALMLLFTIVFTYLMYNGKAITILSSVKSLLFLTIIAVLLYDKSKIPPDSKGMIGISVEFGLILSFIFSVIIIFSNKIESGLIISDPNNIVTKLHNIFQKKFIGFIGIGIMILGLLLAFLGSGSEGKTSSKDLGLGDKSKSESNSTTDDLKKKELELKQKELELKEKELNKQNSAQNNSQNNLSNGKYPQASNRLIAGQDLIGMSKYELKIMRNEIFARHGYIFKTDDMRNYFNSQSWYTPMYDDVTSMLSSVEKTNIDFIKSFEK